MGMRETWAIAHLLMVPAVGQTRPPAEALFNANGYRIAYYRAPVAQPPEGVRRIAPSAVAPLRADRDVIL